MRVFIYEYTCAAPPNAVAPSLAREGRSMLTAVFADFAELDGVEPVTLLHAHHPSVFAGARWLDASTHEEAVFRELAGAADWALVIAPEFDYLLLNRCRWVEESGGRLLGPDSSAVALSGDKLVLAEHLQARGVTTPRCWTAETEQSSRTLEFPAVLKPRHGAGSQATCLIRNEIEFREKLPALRDEAPTDEMILQQYVPGKAASVAFVLGDRELVPLLPGEQRLSGDGRLCYLGGRFPLSEQLARRAIALGRKAIAAVPGLKGYVGVDLVFGNADDGSADWVIEINPRLTTSYLGLRALCRSNLAELMLGIASGDMVLPPLWRPGAVEFLPDGTITRLPP